MCENYHVAPRNHRSSELNIIVAFENVQHFNDFLLLLVDVARKLRKTS
jgi:hypothetical protein